jgi:hypothetical protein
MQAGGICRATRFNSFYDKVPTLPGRTAQPHAAIAGDCLNTPISPPSYTFWILRYIRTIEMTASGIIWRRLTIR